MVELPFRPRLLSSPKPPEAVASEMPGFTIALAGRTLGSGCNLSTTAITPVPHRVSLNRAWVKLRGSFGIRGPSPLHDAARFRARSTLHTVAAQGGCTNIPLAAGRGSGGRNHSVNRHFRPWLLSVRPPGSARTDQVLEDLRIC